eukprot:TRINITY_DN8809_c0_g2_i2.p1 TRINITY_DN8809_c0_g2~~TRINITY_DN8809_c0_g2_i2.p1  ORF type:complete len:2059 (+),score=766.86 TRINITY_DN8809_c0_g2_i2:472-6177(+)
MQGHAGLDILSQSVFHEVSNELNQRKNEIGWPVCLATAPNAAHLQTNSIAFAVGTSGGFVLLFSAAGKRRTILGGLHDDEENACNGCSCIELHPTGTYLLAGFQTGHLVFFDTATGPLKIVKDVRHPLHSVKWVGNEPNKAAMLDVVGNLKIVTLKKVPGLKTKFLTNTQSIATSEQGILEMDTITTHMVHNTILAAVSKASVYFYHLNNTGGAESFYTYTLPASVTQPKDKRENQRRERHRRSMKGKQARRPEPKKDKGKEKEKEKLDVLPAVSWLMNCKEGGEVAVVWSDYLVVFRVVEKETSVSIVKVTEMVLKHVAVASTFLAKRVIGMVDPVGRVFLVDPYTEKGRNAIVDVGSTQVAPVTSNVNNKRSFSQAVKGYAKDSSASYYILSRTPIKLNKVDIMSWRDRLNLLRPQRTALDLAKDMKYDRAPAVVGLPHLLSTREATLNEVIKTLLREYLDDKVATGPPQGTDAEDWWESLASYTMNYCCTVEQPNLVFSVLYSYFAQSDYANLWIKLLEPCIDLKRVTGVPDHHLALLMEWLTKGAVLTYRKEEVTHCDGTGDTFFEVPNNNIINPRTFTIDVWVQADNPGDDAQCAVSSIDTDNSAGWAFITERGKWSFHLGDGDDWVVLSPDAVPKKLPSGWTRLTAVYHSSELVFYINSIQVGHAETTYQPNRNKNVPLIIGGVKELIDDRYERTRGFRGRVRNLQVYSSPHNPFQPPVVYDTESESDNDNESQAVTANTGADRSWTEHGPESKTPTVGERSWYGDKDKNDHSSLDGLTLADVQSAVSEDEAGIGDQSNALAQMEIGNRLDNVLLKIDPKAMHDAEGDYSCVLQFATTWHLYKSFASYHNKAKPGVLGYINPLSPMFTMLKTPIEGSLVGRKGDEAVQGTVLSVTEDVAMVQWEADGKPLTVHNKDELKVLEDSKPNNKLRKTLLQYLKNIFMGKTFHGADVPLDQQLAVKVQALEFLFLDDGDTKVEVHHKVYKVLEHLLRASAKELLDSISVAFCDTDVARSPWRRAAEAKSGTDQPLRFRLSRDQVTAILNNKLKINEFGPFEVEKTFAREWPKPTDISKFFTLITDAIGMEIVQPKRFNKDMIKRIVAHLAHDCPAKEKVKMQKKIAKMLSVAFDPMKGCWKEGPTEEENMQFHKLAHEAGFTLLSIYLYKREANYSAVLRTYLRAHEENSRLVQEDGLFAFLEQTMESMGGDPAMAENKSKLQKAVLDHLEDLVKVDSAKAANIVVKHLQSKHTDILQMLDSDKKTQYSYLKGMIEASNNNDIPAIVLDVPTVEKYIKLLCMYDESNILNFLRDHETVIDISKTLTVLENTKGESDDMAYGRDTAIAYLYSRTGRYKEGINRHFKRLQVLMKDVRSKLVDQEIRRRDGTSTSGAPTTPALSGYDTAPTTPAYTATKSRRKSTLTSEHRSFFRYRSDASDARYGCIEILETSEGRAVTELVERCLDICKDSTKGGVEDISEVWFTLLEKLVEPKKVLSEIEAQSRNWSKRECLVTAGVACVAVLVVLRSRKIKYVECGAPAPPEAPPKEEVFDELAEVQKQELKHTMSAVGGFVVKKVTVEPKKLAHSLSLTMFSVNQALQELYTHYITVVLLKMMSAHNTSLIDDQETSELHSLVKKCKDAMAKAVRDEGAAAEFAQLKKTLARKTQRVESVVLKKILDSHKESTFVEYKAVLLGMLESARFEASMKKCLNDCLESDTGALHARSVRKSTMAWPHKLVGEQPWTQVCATCKVPFSAKPLKSWAFVCGHNHHEACLAGSDQCTICFGKTGCKEEPVLEEAAATLHAVTFKVSNLKKLNNRLAHTEIHNLLHGEAGPASKASSLHLAPAPLQELTDSEEEGEEEPSIDESETEYEDEASMEDIILDAIPFHENETFLFPFND